jgi:hypothetical protein
MTALPDTVMIKLKAFADTFMDTVAPPAVVVEPLPPPVVVVVPAPPAALTPAPAAPPPGGDVVMEEPVKAEAGEVPEAAGAGALAWVARRARWVTLKARWVTLRARCVTLRAR